MDVHKVGVHRHAKDPVIELSSLKNLENAHDIELYLEKTWRKKRLDIPDFVAHAISGYLRMVAQGKHLDKDCFSFACMVMGEPFYSQNDLNKHFEILPLPKHLHQGDVIVIITPEEKYTHFHHAAVSVGKNLFISVYGRAGEIMVSSLEDMLRDFKGKEVRLLKKQAPTT